MVPRRPPGRRTAHGRAAAISVPPSDRNTDDVEFFLIALIVAAVPFVLPIVSLVRQSTLRADVRRLQDALLDQERTVDELKRRVVQLSKEVAQRTPAAEPGVSTPPVVAPPPVATPPPPIATPVVSET